jgi:hypothetical protein
MKTMTSLLCVTLCLCTTLFFSSCQPTQPDPDEKFKFRVYNSEVAEAELIHLSSLDTAKLSDDELLEKITREGDLVEIQEKLKASELFYWTTMEAQYARIPPGVPPTPCPIQGGCDQPIAIGAVDLGVVMAGRDSVPPGNAARMSSIPDPTVTLLLDSTHIFAIGKITTPADPVFHTARFHFTVVDEKLKSKDLILLITTSILKDGKVVPVEMKAPVPANAFSTD